MECYSSTAGKSSTDCDGGSIVIERWLGKQSCINDNHVDYYLKEMLAFVYYHSIVNNNRSKASSVRCIGERTSVINQVVCMIHPTGRGLLQFTEHWFVSIYEWISILKNSIVCLPISTVSCLLLCQNWSKG